MSIKAVKLAIFLVSSCVINSSYAAVNFLLGPAADISETGVVAGNITGLFSYSPNPTYGHPSPVISHAAYLWDINTQSDKNSMDFFGVPGVDSHHATSVSAINSNGTLAVGTVFNGEPKVWPHTYNDPGGVYPIKYVFTGINNNIYVASHADNSGGMDANGYGETIALRWVSMGSTTGTAWSIMMLETPDKASSKTSDINNEGVITGHTITVSETIATFWRGTTATYLQNPNGGPSFASSINDAGQIVGSAGGQAMFWNNDGIATSLKSLTSNGYALSISTNGLIAGYSFIQNSTEDRLATLWIGGKAFNLNNNLSEEDKDAGWLLAEATGVNSQGYVVGKAVNTKTGAIAGFVTPVPEPETYALMMGGLGLVGAAVRRRRSN